MDGKGENVFPEWTTMSNVQNDLNRIVKCPLCGIDDLRLDIVYMKQNFGWHWRFSLPEVERIWKCEACAVRGTTRQLERLAHTPINYIKNSLHKGETVFVEWVTSNRITTQAGWQTVIARNIVKLVPDGEGRCTFYWWNGDWKPPTSQSQLIETLESNWCVRRFNTEKEAISWISEQGENHEA